MTFPPDPDDPTLVPKAAQAWLDEMRRRKVNGEAPPAPQQPASPDPAPSKPAKGATVGSLLASQVAAAAHGRQLLVASGRAGRGELSKYDDLLTLNTWLQVQADHPAVRAVLSRQPRFVDPADFEALLALRASTRIEQGRLVQKPVALQTVRLAAYALRGVAESVTDEMPPLRKGWQKRLTVKHSAVAADAVPTMSELAALERAVQACLRSHSAAVQDSIERFGLLPRRSQGVKARVLAAAAAGVQLLLATGLREGELLGLRWRDVDRVNNTVTVRQQRRRVAGGAWVTSETKTKAGQDRTVPLTDHGREAVDFLAALSAGVDDPDCPVLSIPVRRRPQPGAEPSPPHPVGLAALAGALDKATAAAGLGEWNLHRLRKAWATKLAFNGVPEMTVQQVGGWTDVNTLKRVYQQVRSSDPVVLDVVRSGGNKALK